MIGKKFSKLTIIDQLTEKKFKCICDCGNTIEVFLGRLLRGSRKSCGCQRKGSGRLKHGMSDSRFYKVWIGLKNRCCNKNNSAYKNYGKRGIGICKQWIIFDNFYKDMSLSYTEHVKIYGEENTTIERVNNEKGYSRENCRWATKKEQANNKRDIMIQNQRWFKAIRYDGETIFSNNQSEFARKYNLKSPHINRCLNKIRQSTGGWKFYYIDEDIKILCGSSPNKRRNISEKETQYLDALKRGVYLAKDVKSGDFVSREDVYFAVPLQKGQISVKEFTKDFKIGESKELSKDSPLLAKDVCDEDLDIDMINERGL